MLRRQAAPGAVPWGQAGTVALALLVGLVLGFLGVSRGCSPTPAGAGVSQERYAVLAGTLYAEGESLAVVREYLAALGNVDQAAFVMRLAERYSNAGDRSKQRQAEELRQLGQALQRTAGAVEIPAVITAPVAVGGDSSAATPVGSPEAWPVPPATAIVRSPQGDGVRLRAEANTKAAAIALLGNGSRVEILNVVEGEQVEKNEKRWYKVRSGQRVGYVYFTLIVPAD